MEAALLFVRAAIAASGFGWQARLPNMPRGPSVHLPLPASSAALHLANASR